MKDFLGKVFGRKTSTSEESLPEEPESPYGPYVRADRIIHDHLQYVGWKHKDCPEIGETDDGLPKHQIRVTKDWQSFVCEACEAEEPFVRDREPFFGEEFVISQDL